MKILLVLMTNMKKNEVVEGYNDENRSTKDDPNHHNVEEENSEDSLTRKDIKVLQVVAIQYICDQMGSQGTTRNKIIR